MYLLTVVTLLICVISIYAQIYAVQAARLFGNETTVADDMLTWQNAAAAATEAALQTSTTAVMSAVGTGGCGLSAASNASQFSMCGSVAALTSASSYWPAGYNPNLAWNSVIFQPGGGTATYVITWAPPPSANDSADPITAPPIGISLSDLYTEIRNDTNIPVYEYGIVSGTQLTTTAVPAPGGSPIAYPLPTGITIPNGSVALISPP